LQWFKSTIWLEFFAVLAVLTVFKEYFFSKGLRKVILPVTLVGCIFWALYIFPGIDIIRNSTKYEFPFYTKATDAINISRQAKEKTPKDALFLQPCSFSELKFYGERSSYVDFKAVTHKKSFLKEWGERFIKVYNIKIDEGKNGFEACDAGDAYFRNLTAADISKLKEETSADYLLTYSSRKLSLPVVAQNATYIIYKLK
jgi:hypothetical protein